MKKSPNKTDATKGNKRVGIFRGTFDPIHLGHIEFAKQAILSAQLERIYFLPEKIPQHKKATESYKNRLAMISHATAQHANLHLLELPNMQGSIEPILPELKKIFGDAQLVFLMGSDVAKTIHQWHDADSLCHGNEFIVGMRQDDSPSEIENMLNSLAIKPLKVTVVNAPKPTATSSAIREEFNKNTPSKDLPKSVHSLATKKQFYKKPLLPLKP